MHAYDQYICADRVAEKIILASLPSGYSMNPNIQLTERGLLNQKIIGLEGDVKLLLRKLESGANKQKDDIKRAYETIKTKKSELIKARVQLMKLK